jgi:hypothetical protein
MAGDPLRPRSWQAAGSGSSLWTGVSSTAGLGTGWLPLELADALVIEQPNPTIRREEDRDPLPHDEGLGVVDEKMVPIDQRDRERPEGTLALECAKSPLEIRGIHQHASLRGNGSTRTCSFYADASRSGDAPNSGSWCPMMARRRRPTYSQELS